MASLPTLPDLTTNNSDKKTIHFFASPDKELMGDEKLSKYQVKQTPLEIDAKLNDDFNTFERWLEEYESLRETFK